VLWTIAFPFLVGFLRDRSNWGLLVPAYVLTAVGLMVALIGLEVLDDLLIPAYVMFAIALPFLVVYLRNPKEWWPLIPGGIMAVIGFSFLIVEAAAQYIVGVALLVAGAWILVRQFVRKESPPMQGDEPAQMQAYKAPQPQGDEPAEPPAE
jgi:hypothetical protein